MPHITLPEPPIQTPVFMDLSVKDLLRGPGRLFRFLVGAVWADWFGLVTEKANPLIVKATLDFPSVAAQSTEDLSVTVNGAETDHHAEVAPPDAVMLAGLGYLAWVSAVNTVKVRCINVTAGALNPASAKFTVIVRK